MESRGLVRVRIRGVYATALTGIMVETGFQVVQVSRVIAERMSVPRLDLPADVTVKSSEHDPGEILVIGYPWAVDRVVSALRARLPYSLYLEGVLPVYATLVATITGLRDGRCFASTGGVEVVVEGASTCNPGERIVGYVARTGVRGGEKPVLKPGVRVVGDYVMLSRAPGRVSVTISEHVRSSERRALLLSLASKYTSMGVSIHWRSSASIARPEDLEAELRDLYARLLDLEERVERSGEGVYSEGEKVVLVSLSSLDKEVLDEIRARYAPTSPLHHSLKSLGSRELSLVVDFADALIASGLERSSVRRGVLFFLAEQLKRRGRVRVLHQKLDGHLIRLGEPSVVSVEVGDGFLQLLLRRTVKSSGVYDGLGVAKEPGDVIETLVDTKAWKIVHRYYGSGGELKGAYININTPPEVSPTTIRYIDLEVDVVKKPGEKPRLVDLEELERAYREEKITRSMVEKIAEAVSEESPELGEKVRELLG